MEDAAGVAITDGGDELLEVATGLVFVETAFVGDFREEFAAFGEFHDEVDFGLGGENLVEPHDVRLAEAAHDGDLALHVPGESVSCDFLLVDHLHRHALPVLRVPRVVHLRERAAS